MNMSWENLRQRLLNVSIPVFGTGVISTCKGGEETAIDLKLNTLQDQSVGVHGNRDRGSLPNFEFRFAYLPIFTEYIVLGSFRLTSSYQYFLSLPPLLPSSLRPSLISFLPTFLPSLRPSLLLRPVGSGGVWWGISGPYLYISISPSFLLAQQSSVSQVFHNAVHVTTRVL